MCLTSAISEVKRSNPSRARITQNRLLSHLPARRANAQTPNWWLFLGSRWRTGEADPLIGQPPFHVRGM